MENKFLVPIGVLAFLKVRILYMVQYTIYIVYMYIYIYIIMVIKEVNSDNLLPRCQPRLCFWASYSTSPCLGSLLCKRKIISLLIVRLDKPMCVKWIKWYPKHDPWLAIIITLIYILNFYCLFTFGCTGPSLLSAQLSPVGTSRGCSSLRRAGFSLWWFLLLWAQAVGAHGLSSCGPWV